MPYSVLMQEPLEDIVDPLVVEMTTGLFEDGDVQVALIDASLERVYVEAEKIPQLVALLWQAYGIYKGLV
jgi:hypothetical protein